MTAIKEAIRACKQFISTETLSGEWLDTFGVVFDAAQKYDDVRNKNRGEGCTCGKCLFETGLECKFQSPATSPKSCETCEGHGRIQCDVDSAHTHPCDDCRPKQLEEFNRGYAAASQHECEGLVEETENNWKCVLIKGFPFDGMPHSDAQDRLEVRQAVGLTVMLETEGGSFDEEEYGKYVWRLTAAGEICLSEHRKNMEKR